MRLLLYQTVRQWTPSVFMPDTNAIERVNAELDRRAKVVGIFPNSDALLRLFTAVLQDQHDDWQEGRRHSVSSRWRGWLHPDGPPLLTNPLAEGLVASLTDVVRTPPNSHHYRPLDQRCAPVR